MRIIAYKMMTHARLVGFVAFKDGNKYNFNKFNLQKIGLNEVLNDIIDKKNQTNWDINLTEEERKYIEKNPNEIAKYIYCDN
jgi:hypothetical protein